MKLNIKTSEPDFVEVEFLEEDISMLHALREILLADKDVEFVAAKKDHPQVGIPTLVLRTKKGDALDTLSDALKKLRKEINEFRDELKKAKKSKSK